MPLASFALIGWVGGQLPSAFGSTHGSRVAAVAFAADGSRGTGGNGNGAADHSTPLGRSCARAFQARHAPYATPPRSPRPSARVTALRTGRPVRVFHPANSLMRGRVAADRRFDERRRH